MRFIYEYENRATFSISNLHEAICVYSYSCYIYKVVLEFWYIQIATALCLQYKNHSPCGICMIETVIPAVMSPMRNLGLQDHSQLSMGKRIKMNCFNSSILVGGISSFFNISGTFNCMYTCQYKLLYININEKLPISNKQLRFVLSYP